MTDPSVESLDAALARGRMPFVKSLADEHATVGMAAGYAIAGPALELWGPRTVVLGVAVFVLLLGLLWLGPARRGAAWPDRALAPVA